MNWFVEMFIPLAGVLSAYLIYIVCLAFEPWKGLKKDA